MWKAAPAAFHIRVTAGCDRRAASPGHPFRLALEFEVALQPPLRHFTGLDCFQHSTSGFTGVRAVVEPALLGEFLDLGEHRFETLATFGQPDPPQSGRVDDQPAPVEHDQLAVHCRVPATAVGCSNVLRLHHIDPGQGVDQSGLTGPRRPDKHGRPACTQVSGDSLDAVTGQ
jgi:hypothetical protein